MTAKTFETWLQRLGYFEEPSVLHQHGHSIPETHPYALEIHSLLRPQGAVRARAVFDVEGVPTVVFVGPDEAPLSPSELDQIRQKVWNQNLAAVVIELSETLAKAYPAIRLNNSEEQLLFQHARPDGPFSALDIASANLATRLPKWFDINQRVDRRLLTNLSVTVRKLTRFGFRDIDDDDMQHRYAELLMGQVLFVSYLEHRNIVGLTYRKRRTVGTLHDLISSADHSGISRLIQNLRQDFNGDFLGEDSLNPWCLLSEIGYTLIDDFLSHTDMETGQGSFWNYDFSYIPVELLSGLYESLLSSDEKSKNSAYYTPRHLAMLAVDQAFEGLQDPCSKTIFDGACGSGILLTTAFRRLIALVQARKHRILGLRDRIEVLKKRIFGADVNRMACRVTAFSLYLSLLEGLDPADIIDAQEREDIKLPSLDGTNLRHGNSGDFFNINHGFSDRKFDIIVSNPPWKEPSAESETSADQWANNTNIPPVRRQIAGAYAIRSLEFLADTGRLCLILPISLILAPSSRQFVGYFLGRVQPKRLINFGDLQGLLFPTSSNTCHLFVGSVRTTLAARSNPLNETFDYCVPKADISLTYGRLTMQSADRHQVQTLSVVEDPQMLTTLMWGDSSDLALWTRLTTFGVFGDFWAGPRSSRRWISRKGVHLKDRSRPAVSSKLLRNKWFIDIETLSRHSPLLHRSLLTNWPEAEETVASTSDDLLRVFHGPRVLFSDGFSREDLSIRAAFLNLPATFTCSIGVIAGPSDDSLLLQFAAVYLRSNLARYFLMIRGWKMLSERNGVHLSDIGSFPFFSVSEAPDPEAARLALSRTSERLAQLARLGEIDQVHGYIASRGAFDDDVFDYFSLSDKERELVLETVDVLLPSIRPRSFKSLYTPAQQLAATRDFNNYSRALAFALTEWRERTRGMGSFHVSVFTGEPTQPGSVGVVRIKYTSEHTIQPIVDSRIDDSLVQETLTQLRRLGLTIIPSGDVLRLIPDAFIWADGTLYIARLLTRRNWTRRQASRDAEHIVRTVQNNLAPSNGSEGLCKE